MSTCGMYLQSKIVPPSNWTPLRASAHIFAFEAGFKHCGVKIKENKIACKNGTPAWDVYVIHPLKKRGTCIGTMIDRACEPFGPYKY